MRERLFVGALIIDEVVRLTQSPGSLDRIAGLIALEFGLARSQMPRLRAE